MSPLHQLRHAVMLLSHSSTVARATELAGPVRNPLLFFCWNLKKEEKWKLSVYINTGIFWNCQRAAKSAPMTEPSMLQLQLSRSCVKHSVSVRLKRSRSSLVEKVVCSAPLPRSTTVPESPCLDTCLWNTRSSIVPVRNQCRTLNKNLIMLKY